jgi:ribulose-5-phosphate 4-epimerase/fuculose-1-phosphate aldolase
MPDTLNRDEITESIARSCRILGKLDLTHAALGHVSYRASEDTLFIKGKGPDEVGLRYTTPDDIIEVNFAGEKVAGKEGLQPPSESFIHIWLMRKNAGVNSVIHVHPEHAVLLTVCEKEVLPIYAAYGSGARIALDGVETYQRSITISNDTLGEDFADFMGQKKVALMRGHGVTVVGNGIEDATVRSLALNELVTMMYKAYALGVPYPIPEEDVELMNRRAADTGPRKRGSAGGEAGMLAAYRYYRSLAGEDQD